MPEILCSPPCSRTDSGRLRLSALLALAVAGVVACGEDVPAPTAPEAAPAPAVTAVAAAPAFMQVSSAGFSGTCGVTTDNRAFCWGFYPQANAVLGNGTTGGSRSPVAVSGSLQFRQISSGGSSYCGVTLDFRAYCWGSNGRGELGDGTLTRRLVPIAVAGGHRFRQVDVAFEHACGVSYPDNRLYCWGWNRDGQLGDGTRTDRLTPVAVATTALFRQVTVGYYHTCAVTMTSQLFCWGKNDVGQVGDSTSVGRRLKPVRVARSRLFRQVDAGGSTSCAVTTEDRAFCWGEGRQGQVGNDRTAFFFWPRPVSGGRTFDRVSVGSFLTCGEAAGNQAYCWGLIVDPLTSTVPVTTPQAVPGGRTFAQVSAGGIHACGVTSGGVGYCWGRNVEGQFGDGTTTSSATPVAIGGPD